MVGLAYLPDIASLTLRLLGVGPGRAIGHSLVFALAAACVLAPWLRALGNSSTTRAFWLLLLSVLAHDLLDLLQSTDRMPLWPFSHREMGFESGLIPERSLGEAAVFGPLFIAFLALWRRRSTKSTAAERPLGTGVVVGWAAAATLLVVAALVHKVRDSRDDRHHVAATLLEQGRPSEALLILERPEGWLRGTKPGRSDYLKAEAYLMTGERAKAERHYLLSLAADPDYFWALADLAAFYASSELPLAERERRVAPYLERLRRDFPRHRALPRTLERVARKLAESPAAGANGG